MTAGRMAVCADPARRALSLLQPADFAGAGYVNEPGAWCWSELETPYPGEAVAFYFAVFGWRAEPFRDSDTDRVFFAGDAPIGSVRRLDGGPETWAVYFQVDDCDAAVARVTELGGKSLGDAERHPRHRPHGHGRRHRRGRSSTYAAAHLVDRSRALEGAPMRAPVHVCAQARPVQMCVSARATAAAASTSPLP